MTQPTADEHYELTFTPVAGPVDPEPPAPPLPHPPPLGLLFVPPLYTYAYGPGYFLRHESAEEFDQGETAGLWGPRESALSVTEEVKDAIEELCLRGAPKGEGGETPPYQGGARVGRGYLYLDEFNGATPADQLRDAIARTNQAIVPLPGTVIDTQDSPILMPARKVIKGLGGPQNEFKGSWPVYFRGSKAALRNAPNGSNYNGNKGWGLSDICLVGQEGIPMIEPVTAANQIDYISIDGCSFDTWKFILDGPTLGLHIGGECYTNNIAGLFAYRFKGSDGHVFTGGGKLDFGGRFRDPNATNIIFSWCEKTFVGPVYITGDPARCILIEGGLDRGGVKLMGLVLEGRNAGAPSAGAVLRVTSGDAVAVGCEFNFAKGVRDEGIVNVAGGSLSLIGPRFRRAAGYGPEVVQSGGVLDVSGARAIYTDRAPGPIELRRTGGTLLAADGTVKLV